MMKTIGLIGGMSWESTATYYALINQGVNQRLGGFHSAKICLISVDFDVIEKCQQTGDWQRSGQILGEAAQSLEKAGADFIVICTNTMHKVIDQIEAQVTIPVLHIADATIQALKEAKVTTVALLGTRYTMTQPFYKSRLEAAGLTVLTPQADDCDHVNSIIFNELVAGTIDPASRAIYQRVIADLAKQGAEGVILGCTEIGLLISDQESVIPVFDTTTIHAQAAVTYAVGI